MATKKQIEANRKNAKKSTGPKSDQGKLTVRENGVKHGLCARKVTVGNEDIVEFDVFKEEMLKVLHPVTALEKMLGNRAIEAAWRLKRVRDMETQMFTQAIGCIKQNVTADDESLIINAFDREQRNIALLHRYETAIERTMYKALKHLKVAKEERKIEEMEKAEFQEALEKYLTDRKVVK